MSLASVAGGIGTAGVVALAVGITAVAGAASGTGSDPGTAVLAGPLRPGAVPDPALLPWVSRAGSLCPAVTPALIAAQIRIESSWDPRQVSPLGAEGLAQFMPGIWGAAGLTDRLDEGIGRAGLTGCGRLSGSL